MANPRGESWPFSPWAEAYPFEGFLAAATAKDSLGRLVQANARLDLDVDGDPITSVELNLAALPWASMAERSKDASLDPSAVELIVLARSRTLKRSHICERRSLSELMTNPLASPVLIDHAAVLCDRWWLQIDVALVRTTTGQEDPFPYRVLDRVSFTWSRPTDESAPDIGFLTDSVRKERHLSRQVLSWADLGTEPACRKGAAVEQIWVDSTILKRFEENPGDPGLTVLVASLLDQALGAVLVGGHARHVSRSCECPPDAAPESGSLLASLEKRARRKEIGLALDQFEELAWMAITQDVSKVRDLAERWLDAVQDEAVGEDDE